ncbi:putative RNA-directed DNA polymerase from transposon BS [Amphibalanus amphitrite]|uniref:Putative RNA-directed DNA polymerase from transposon BS n=1 Tax=Amphibalanus amphitrite TaxID=1232801 RepID=A0A6A4X5W9_AMPAM|nr:putative RNA-directed DNA polymerase from transposon BS [Amphibalanus amphitrite]
MFWRFVSSMSGDSPRCSGLQIEHNGRILRTEADRGEAFLDRFVQQCSQDDHAAREQLRSALDDAIDIRGTPPAFTAQDLEQAIARLSDTSCGPDRLRSSDFRALSDQERRALLEEMNSSIATGTIPAHWTDSFLVPIPKPGKDHHTLQGYRIITVQNIGGKLVEGLVSRQLSSYLEQHLPATLGAYRPGRATWLNVGQVVHTTFEAFEAREHTLMVGLDLQDAYNLVSVPKLARLLMDLGVNPYLVRWLLSAFQSRRCALKCGRWLSEWTSLMMALPQGSPLSPICFNAYTLPIASMSLPSKFHVLTFADNVLVVGTGKDMAVLERHMQEALDDILTICQNASMEINPAKATACVLSLSKHCPLPCRLRYDGQPIPDTETITHLGVTLDRRLTFGAHIEKVVSRCTRALGTLKMAQKRGVCQRRIVELYRSLILSRLTYGGEVITASPSSLERLDRIQNAALRIATGCTRDTARPTLRVDVRSVPQKIETLRVTAVAKILETPGHPLRTAVQSMTDRAPLRRLQKSGWIRQACATLRDIKGRHSLRAGPQFAATPDCVSDAWNIMACHSLDRSCREWPPGVANAAFEELLDEIHDRDTATLVLATDGSVTRDPPRSGWGCFLRYGESTRCTSGACRLTLSSMRAEMEAVTLGLCAARELAPDAEHIIIATDSKSLLRKLETGWSPPEWQQVPQRITWLYCPGHSGISMNEKADRLAGEGSSATSRIVLSASDIRHIVNDYQREAEAQEALHRGSREVERMVERGLRRGWVAKSHRRGAVGRLACQLACGTISRRTLADVQSVGGAEAAWTRIFGSRSASEAAAEE